VKALKLSEASASNFVTVARKSKMVPELKTAIMEGNLSVAKARKITPVITPENSQEWIDKAIELPKALLEKDVAQHSPEVKVIERAKYVSPSRIELKLGISEELQKKLDQARDLVSQKKKTAASYEMTLEEILNDYLDRHDPVAKAKRAQDRKIRKTAETRPPEETLTNNTAASVPDQSEGKISETHADQRSPIPAHIKHQVHLRDGFQCTHIHNNTRCTQKRWLDVHHIQHVALGGDNSLENLTTLCSAHHKARHLH
jgi:hypothetical protein